jgi:sugar phosphate isomerase/epimerase
MIRFAVMTFMYRGHIARGDLSHEELLDLLAAAGADGIEVFDRDFLGDPGLVKRYRRSVAETGLRVPVIAVMVDLPWTSPGERRETADALRRGLDLCAEFEAEIAHVAGSRLPAGMAPAEARRRMAELLAEHGDYAAERGLVLAIENFDPAPDLVCRAEDCLEIMKLSGDVVGCVFDTGNFQAVGQRADEQLDLLYDRICHCHFKDFAPNDSERGFGGTVFGTGMIPNREVAAELLRRGYSGWVALESYPQAGAGPRETAPPELATLKEMLTPPSA